MARKLTWQRMQQSGLRKLTVVGELFRMLMRGGTVPFQQVNVLQNKVVAIHSLF